MQKKSNYPKIYFIITTVLFISLLFLSLLFANEKDIVFWFALSFICPGITWIVERKINLKHPKIFNIIAHILNIINIIVQCLLILILLMMISIIEENAYKEYRDINDYPKALSSHSDIDYFPKEIPKNAKNINFLNTSPSFTGDCTFFLQFDIDKDYIKKEEEKYKHTGKIIHIRKDSTVSSGRKVEYDEFRCAAALSSEISNAAGYKFIIIESASCLRGIATKEQNIVYLLSCD